MDNITISIEDVNILMLLYPDYVVKDSVNFLDREAKVIYTGKPINNLKEHLEKNTLSYISTVGFADIDLKDKVKLLEYVLDIKGRKFNSKYKTYIEAVSDQDFYYSLKILIVTGKFPYDLSSKVSMFSLYKSLNEPLHTMLDTFYKVLELYPFEMIEASLFTFLNRVSNTLIDGVSPKYSLLIKHTKDRIGVKLKPAIVRYSKSQQTEFDLLSLLIELVSIK